MHRRLYLAKSITSSCHSLHRTQATTKGLLPGLLQAPTKLYSAQDVPPKEASARINPYDHTGTTQNAQGKDEAPHAGDQKLNTDRFQEVLLRQALTHVSTCGWSDEALQKAAQDLGLSKAAGGSIPRAKEELVLLFVERSNAIAVELLRKESESLMAKPLSERLARCLRVRLEITQEMTGYFPQAARLLLGPQQARRAAEMLHKYIDDMWHLCGDRSMDLSWYTKRAALGGILSAAQLYMVTDFSPNFTDTWKLIDKRVEDMLEVQKIAAGFPNPIGTVVTGVRNALGKFIPQLDTYEFQGITKA